MSRTAAVRRFLQASLEDGVPVPRDGFATLHVTAPKGFSDLTVTLVPCGGPEDPEGYLSVHVARAGGAPDDPSTRADLRVYWDGTVCVDVPQDPQEDPDA